ncbi:MAG: hypothetical protein QUS11_06630 [Candidatus Fermentibacter sp.]|nr:hypothetical protein [Candidatus Fermentibacter sp.]
MEQNNIEQRIATWILSVRSVDLQRAIANRADDPRETAAREISKYEAELDAISLALARGPSFDELPWWLRPSLDEHGGRLWLSIPESVTHDQTVRREIAALDEVLVEASQLWSTPSGSGCDISFARFVRGAVAEESCGFCALVGSPATDALFGRARTGLRFLVPVPDGFNVDGYLDRMIAAHNAERASEGQPPWKGARANVQVLALIGGAS